MRRQRRLIIDTVLLGVIGALSAQLFTWALGVAQGFFLSGLAGYHPPGLPDEGGVLREVVGPHGLWLIPLATTLGGLISGLLVYSFAPEAEGHGTDTAVKAFHRAGGFIRARVPFLKMVASAITIGSGGAAGREGPTALISAGVGSVYASVGHRSDSERRLLVLAGMAAGLAAIFRSPVGTAIFAIEVLYSSMEFETGMLLYTMLASIVAYVVNGAFVGWQPLFTFPDGVPTPGVSAYAWYSVLGGVSGVVATALPFVFYMTRDAFHALRIPPHVKPAIGGLGVGLIALALPQVLGGGYGWIQEAIDGHLSMELLLLLCLAKLIAFPLTVSSGGSGGVFAPSLFVGAMLGGWIGQIVGQPAAPFVVVGMAAVFGGAARVPIATILMVTEMTGSYQFLVPAAFAVMISYFVQESLSSRLKYRTLYEAQVREGLDSPAHAQDRQRVLLHALGVPRIVLPKSAESDGLVEQLETGIPMVLPDGRSRTLTLREPPVPAAGPDPHGP
jgi:chloride channel protein, CIC family